VSPTPARPRGLLPALGLSAPPAADAAGLDFGFNYDFPVNFEGRPQALGQNVKIEHFWIRTGLFFAKAHLTCALNSDVL